MNVATICIKRPWNLACAARQFAVFIDESKVGGVRNGSEASFEVTPGRHSVYTKIDFYKSKPCVVDLEPGQRASLVCGAKEGMSGVVSALTSLQDYLYLRPEDGPALQLINKSVSSKSTRSRLTPDRKSTSCRPADGWHPASPYRRQSRSPGHSPGCP